MELQPIQSKIYEIRGQRVMLDRDLAELYQVTTSALNQAVKRNIERFPPDSMLSAVLKSSVAIQVSIAIMRAFVAMRNYITTTTTVTAELAEIRAKLALLERVDADNAEAVSDLSEDMRKELDNIYNAIAALSVKIPQARKPARKIGFQQAEQKAEE